MDEPAGATSESPPPPAVLLLHGLGQMPVAWQDQVTALPTGWRGYAPWLPGLKPTDKAGFELDRAVGELVTYLETNGVRRTHVVGVSLGAVVALRLAARHPDLVDRLVLGGGQVAPPRMALKLQLAVMRRTRAEKFLAEGETKERAIAAVEALARLDLRGDLKRVQAPTLVLAGSRDRSNQAAAKALAAGIRGARLATLDGGHLLNTSAPHEFNRAMFGFLTGEPADGRR